MNDLTFDQRIELSRVRYRMFLGTCILAGIGYLMIRFVGPPDKGLIDPNSILNWLEGLLAGTLLTYYFTEVAPKMFGKMLKKKPKPTKPEKP